MFTFRSTTVVIYLDIQLAQYYVIPRQFCSVWWSWMLVYGVTDCWITNIARHIGHISQDCSHVTNGSHQTVCLVNTSIVTVAWQMYVRSRLHRSSMIIAWIRMEILSEKGTGRYRQLPPKYPVHRKTNISYNTWSKSPYLHHGDSWDQNF